MFGSKRGTCHMTPNVSCHLPAQHLPLHAICYCAVNVGGQPELCWCLFFTRTHIMNLLFILFSLVNPTVKSIIMTHIKPE